MVGDCDALEAGPDGLHRLRQPEVQHLHRAVWPKLDVRGFEVAVDDPLLVRGFERVGDLLRDRQRFVERDRAARQPLRQIVAFDQFHDERMHAAGFFKSVNVAMLGWLRDASDLRLALKPREPIGVAREQIRQNLDRDIAIELRVPRAIHLAHAARADRRDDFVRAEMGAGSQGHRASDEREAFIVQPGIHDNRKAQRDPTLP